MPALHCVCCLHTPHNTLNALSSDQACAQANAFTATEITPVSLVQPAVLSAECECSQASSLDAAPSEAPGA